MGVTVKALVQHYDNLIQILTEQLQQAKAGRAAALACSDDSPTAVPVWLGFDEETGRGVVRVDGLEIALTAREGRVAEAFAIATANTLSSSELDCYIPDRAGPRVLRQLVRKFPSLSPHITFPGKENKGAGYVFRLVDGLSIEES